MSTLKSRLKTITHSRPIIYGTHATLLKPADKRGDPSHTHKWTVYVRGIHNEDLSLYIKKVQFKLHESFEHPVRTCEAPPYEVHETGWGEFDIPIKVLLNETIERGTINLVHTLQLYPKDNDPASTTTTTTAKAVVSEHYEEIVFNEPTDDAHKKLAAHPVPVIPKRTPLSITHPFLPATEQDELRKLTAANEKVVEQLERDRERLERAEEELARLKAALGEE
ncbi:yeats family-domain-containing protein [Powellomyces hirtus]|nr:yeats family-domain-containing protein [Powellomyces hirtus]